MPAAELAKSLVAYQLVPIFGLMIEPDSNPVLTCEL